MLQREEISCDWCGAADGEPLFQGPDFLSGMPGSFQLVKCQTCGLIRQNPRLVWESLQHYYPEDYSAYETIIETEKSRLRRLDRRYGMWKRLRAIERFQPNGRLLDVGCGTGIFLAEVQSTGRWEIMGIEPSTLAARYARRFLNNTILEAKFSEVDLPESSFDVITMWNVLEHLDHPIEDLRRAHRLLKEGGWLVFSIPNLESWEARVFGSYWLGWDLPRHLYLFPRQLLLTILSTIGFHSVDIRCIATSHAALGLSLDFLMKAHTAQDSGIRKFLLRFYYSPFMRIALAPPLWILDRLNLSSIVTVFAQKNPSLHEERATTGTVN